MTFPKSLLVLFLLSKSFRCDFFTRLSHFWIFFVFLCLFLGFFLSLSQDLDQLSSQLLVFESSLLFLFAHLLDICVDYGQWSDNRLHTLVFELLCSVDDDLLVFTQVLIQSWRDVCDSLHLVCSLDDLSHDWQETVQLVTVGFCNLLVWILID